MPSKIGTARKDCYWTFRGKTQSALSDGWTSFGLASLVLTTSSGRQSRRSHRRDLILYFDFPSALNTIYDGEGVSFTLARRASKRSSCLSSIYAHPHHGRCGVRFAYHAFVLNNLKFSH